VWAAEDAEMGSSGLLFPNWPYLLFFAVVLLVYWALPWHRGRVWWLLLASFVFYAALSRWLALIICVTSVLDYLIGLGLDAGTSPRLRRLLVSASLLVNLGLLCYLKYANFFLDSLETGLHAAGLNASLPVLRILLPFGISFYTFEAINYTIDVYRRRVPAERSLANFMLFILFFPHLVAGPIVRARDFLPQIARRKRWSWPRAQVGVQLFLLGVFKKFAIADRMADYARPVFEQPGLYHSGAAWLATLAYALQIYCDFSAYTDMALGSAHLLGYKLAPNFNMPYLSANVSEFWRRWHISLSSWLRDYLFIPLGGSRGGFWRTSANLLVTMTLGGLWHGLSWMYVAWGVLHGVYLIVHRGFRDFCRQRPGLDRLLQSVPGTGLRVGLTFVCVCVGWVLFFTAWIEAEQTRACSEKNAAAGVRVERPGYSALGASLTLLGRMTIPTRGQGVDGPAAGLWFTLAVVVLAHVLGHTGLWRKIAPRLPPPVLGFGYAALLTLALVLATDTSKAFIYLQF
jgi:alginate O-acetyltransferase complex protein AlgI